MSQHQDSLNSAVILEAIGPKDKKNEEYSVDIDELDDDDMAKKPIIESVSLPTSEFEKDKKQFSANFSTDNAKYVLFFNAQLP